MPDPVVQSLLVSFGAFLLCLIPASYEHPFIRLSALSLPQWLALLWYGVFITALAFIFWYAGIKRCPASVAAAFSGMMPFTAVLLSALILGEKSGLSQLFGGLLVVLGMVLIGRGHR